jgi:hypothetical protein
MNTPQFEHETPSRQKDFREIAPWLLRHPVIQFAITFCYWFMAASVLNSVWVQVFRATSWTEGYIYLFSPFMAVVFYFMYRGRMKNLKA